MPIYIAYPLGYGKDNIGKIFSSAIPVSRRKKVSATLRG
jgi:hypothetical protein